MKPPFIRTPYNYDMDSVSRETGLACLDESLALQSAAEEADINTIVRRFGLTGELPQDLEMPQSGDYSGATDFHSAMNVVRRAQEEFLKVPADIRARFQNDPQMFADFFNDDKNRPEAIRLGLIPEPPVVLPDAVKPPAGVSGS